MLAFEARRMGYKVITWTGGGADAGPATIADEVIHSPFDCSEALERFLGCADVATVEFENIPAGLLRKVAQEIPMSPAPEPVITCQHREREKNFLSDNEFPCAPFSVVDSAASLESALTKLPTFGGILKTAEFGYDGKGQFPVDANDDAATVWRKFDTPRAVLENKIDLASELSVLVVRDHAGDCECYDPAENTHRHHILDLSIAPGRQPSSTMEEAKKIAMGIAKTLDYRGIMAVEFFVSTDGELLVNEMAPRPHNSGHHTIDACETSQFEQQLRVMCGMPAGSTRLHTPAVLWNILGDIWPNDGGDSTPDWSQINSIPGAKLHLYGKKDARPGRKMGHVTFRGRTVYEALDQALRVRNVFYSG